MPVYKKIGSGSVAVVGVRLEALEAAIRSRDWTAVEFEYDRVNRAFSKIEDVFRDRPWSMDRRR